MKIIDISMPISEEMVVYPGNTPVKISKQYDMDKGDRWNVTDISFSTHTGTHVDAPKHHYSDQPCVAKMGMKGLVGRALVIDVIRAVPAVTKEDIEHVRYMDKFDILLLKTRNSACESSLARFEEEHIYIARDAAEFLVEIGVKGVGIDCLSVERFANPDGAVTHRVLMENNAVACIEGLNLRNVIPGYYFCSCLPIAIEDSDGAPARAVLIPEEEIARPERPVGIRRDGSYYTRIQWASITTENPYYWVCNLIDDDINRFGGTWGANTNGPANAILDFFGETQEIGMFRIFHNVGAPISILEELAKQIKLYVSQDDRCAAFGESDQDINTVEWLEVASTDMEMCEKWTNILLREPVKAKFVRMELVENFGTPPHLPWVETSELKIFPFFRLGWVN